MNYKSIALLTAILSFGFLMFSVVAAKPSSTTVSATQAHQEASLLETLIVINQNEIAAGNLAMKKSTNPAVKNFAALMIKEHSDNLNKTELLSNNLGIKPLKDKLATELKTEGEKEVMDLEKLQDNAFDKAYIDAMVKGHQKALNLINKSMQSSLNPLIKQHLQETAKHVEHHLEKAQAIQKTLQ